MTLHSYPILVATEASFAHVCHTILKSAFPDYNPSTRNIDVQAYKIPANLDREYWTPEYIELLEMDRFRPNIVLGDAPSHDDNSRTPKMVPWEEDGWAAFEIFDRESDAGELDSLCGKDAEGKGQGIYTIVRCARCMVPNVDPATGIRDPHVSKANLPINAFLIYSLLAALSCHPPVEESRSKHK